MKKHLLSLLCISSVCIANAQVGKSYLMMNYNMPINNVNTLHYYRPIRFNRSSSVFPLGIQYIRNFTEHSAMRFGLTLFEKDATNNYSFQTLGDTTMQTYNSFNTLLPKTNIGKEWQKQIHKDVELYGGLDLGLGMGRASKSVNTEKYISNSSGSYTIGSSNGVASIFAFNVSARPFAGLRVNWNRFTVGYESSIPLNYTVINSESVNMVDKPKFQHQLNIGFKLRHKK